MYYKLIKYINGFLYILKPKFENNRQIMKYLIDCLLSYLRNKNFFDLYFSNQSRFNLKSINGI